MAPSAFGRRVGVDVLLICIALVTSSIYATSSTTSAAEPVKSAARFVIEDRSLSSERYVALGLPAHDRTWTGEDMAISAAALKKIAKNHLDQLPRYKSERSAAVFDRITSSDNLELLRNKSILLDARMAAHLDYIRAQNEILNLYLSAYVKRNVSGDDLMELIAAILRTTNVQTELVEEFLPTLSKKDPTYAIRIDGLKKMQRSMAGSANAAIIFLTSDEDPNDGSSPDWRDRFITHCRDSLPAIVQKLTRPTQAEMVTRLDKAARDEKLRRYWPELKQLHDEAAAATKKPGFRFDSGT